MQTIFPGFTALADPVTTPARYRSMIPSVSISVWMPRLRTPLSSSNEHTAFGHRADPDLQARSVLDLGRDEAGDLTIDVGGRRPSAAQGAADRSPSMT